MNDTKQTKNTMTVKIGFVALIIRSPLLPDRRKNPGILSSERKVELLCREGDLLFLSRWKSAVLLSIFCF